MSATRHRQITVEVTHRFAVGIGDGFDYITNIDNWPEYWPGLVRVEPGSRWRAPGDQARLALRLLGRETEMTMTLARIVPYELVEYLSVQRGLPDAHPSAISRTTGPVVSTIGSWCGTRPGPASGVASTACCSGVP